MFLGVYWNQPVCPSVRPSVYKIKVSVKVLAGVLNLFQTINFGLQIERVCPNSPGHRVHENVSPTLAL